MRAKHGCPLSSNAFCGRAAIRQRVAWSDSHAAAPSSSCTPSRSRTAAPSLPRDGATAPSSVSPAPAPNREGAQPRRGSMHRLTSSTRQRFSRGGARSRPTRLPPAPPTAVSAAVSSTCGRGRATLSPASVAGQRRGNGVEGGPSSSSLGVPLGVLGRCRQWEGRRRRQDKREIERGGDEILLPLPVRLMALRRQVLCARKNPYASIILCSLVGLSLSNGLKSKRLPIFFNVNLKF
jgi:hypothetical protein